MRLYLKAGPEPKSNDILTLRKKGVEYIYNAYRPYAIMSNNNKALKFNGVDVCAMLIGKKFKVKDIHKVICPIGAFKYYELTSVILEECND